MYDVDAYINTVVFFNYTLVLPTASSIHNHRIHIQMILRLLPGPEIIREKVATSCQITNHTLEVSMIDESFRLSVDVVVRTPEHVVFLIHIRTSPCSIADGETYCLIDCKTSARSRQ